MRKRIGILALVVVALTLTLSADIFAFGQERGRGRGRDGARSVRLWEGGDHQPRRRYRHRNRYTYGYRNYGQYRRTQVGNRRYRMVRRSYWRDGVRLTRMVRVYY